MKFQREDAVEVRWRLRATPVPKPQKFVVTDVTAKYLFSRLSEAPVEMRITELTQRGDNPGTAFCSWEVHFTVANLLGLKRIIRHLDRSFLVYKFTFRQ